MLSASALSRLLVVPGGTARLQVLRIARFGTATTTSGPTGDSRMRPMPQDSKDRNVEWQNDGKLAGGQAYSEWRREREGTDPRESSKSIEGPTSYEDAQEQAVIRMDDESGWKYGSQERSKSLLEKMKDTTSGFVQTMAEKAKEFATGVVGKPSQDTAAPTQSPQIYKDEDLTAANVKDQMGSGGAAEAASRHRVQSAFGDMAQPDHVDPRELAKAAAEVTKSEGFRKMKEMSTQSSNFDDPSEMENRGLGKTLQMDDTQLNDDNLARTTTQQQWKSLRDASLNKAKDPQREKGARMYTTGKFYNDLPPAPGEAWSRSKFASDPTVDVNQLPGSLSYQNSVSGYEAEAEGRRRGAYKMTAADADKDSLFSNKTTGGAQYTRQVLKERPSSGSDAAREKAFDARQAVREKEFDFRRHVVEDALDNVGRQRFLMTEGSIDTGDDTMQTHAGIDLADDGRKHGGRTLAQDMQANADKNAPTTQKLKKLFSHNESSAAVKEGAKSIGHRLMEGAEYLGNLKK